MSKIISMAIVFFLIFGLASAQSSKPKATVSGSAEKQGKAELLPLLTIPMTATIAIKNIGTGPASPSKLTLDCVKVGVLSQMNSCPDLPPSVMATYFDSAFPNNATIQVPALAPGATFTHTLSFWDAFRWTTGTYKFTAVADASHTIHEKSSPKNIATSTLTIQ